MKRILFILATSVAFSAFGAEHPKPTPHQVKQVIKLTKKHLPISRYFATDDNEEDDFSLVQPVLFRRQTAIKAKTDIAPSEDDYVIPDHIRARLFLARVRALEAFGKTTSRI